MHLRDQQVAAVAALLEEGATVPFIARYRKEATGSLEDTAIAAVRDRIEKLAELDKRRQAIVASLAERELLTEILSSKRIGFLQLIQLLFRLQPRMLRQILLRNFFMEIR